MGTEGWELKAACSGFASPFMTRDVEKGETLDKWKAYDKLRFTAAVAICKTCPVQQECGEAASPEDFKWTVRAARMPSMFNTRPVGRPGVDLSQVVCKRGHKGRTVRRGAKSKILCLECKRENAEKRSRLNGVKPKVKSDTCQRGHKDFVVFPSGARECSTCRKISKAKRMEAAKMGA